jgi:hypothetical protein
MTSYSHCPTNSLPTTTPASTLTPNTFYKLCPPIHPATTRLHQPSCGDGSPFNFFFSRPPLRHLTNHHKLLIEFQGGGACWNERTCSIQNDYLTWNEAYDDFIGKSCSEIEYGLQKSSDGTPLSMLCAKSIGSVDFREYHTIIVPYCTQDVHLGDSIQYYDDENDNYNDNPIKHVGAHNMLSTLQYIYDNFPNPTHIFLTGCSAGGTAVPIAYDLLNRHYNSLVRGGRSVNINVVMDSSVYLTPAEFLENGLGNWGVKSVMGKIYFDFDRVSMDSVVCIWFEI